jgi:hypothetical protein
METQKSKTRDGRRGGGYILQILQKTDIKRKETAKQPANDEMTKQKKKEEKSLTDPTESC